MDRRDVEHGQLPKAFSHIGTALALAALDLGVKAWAEHALADGRPVDLGLLQLRLLFNPSNLADRAADGVVTDYLHTGWFPTFNGADVFITVGAAALLLTAMRPGTKATQGIASCGGAR